MKIFSRLNFKNENIKNFKIKMNPNNDTKTNDTENKDTETKPVTTDTEEVIPFDPVSNPIELLEDKFIKVENCSFARGHRVESLTFEEWNAKQLPKNRILKPSPFDMDIPNVSFGKLDSGNTFNAKGEPMTFPFSALKERKGKGREVAIQLTSPAVISQSGYRDNKTEQGIIRSIGAIMDMSNPHHRHFTEHVCMGLYDQTIDFVLSNPGTFKLENKASVVNLVKTSEDYREAKRDAWKQFSKFVRFPKNGEEIDTESNIRTVYINPSKYVDKVDPRKNNEMKVYLVTQAGKTEISVQDLFDLCAGKEYDSETKGTKMGKPKGFEFSFSWLFSRLTYTSKISLTPRGNAIFIHRIFDAPDIERKDDRHLKELTKSGIDQDISRFVNLGGFTDSLPTNSSTPSSQPIFQPMAPSYAANPTQLMNFNQQPNQQMNNNNFNQNNSNYNQTFTPQNSNNTNPTFQMNTQVSNQNTQFQQSQLTFQTSVPTQNASFQQSQANFQTPAPTQNTPFQQSQTNSQTPSSIQNAPLQQSQIIPQENQFQQNPTIQQTVPVVTEVNTNQNSTNNVKISAIIPPEENKIPVSTPVLPQYQPVQTYTQPPSEFSKIAITSTTQPFGSPPNQPTFLNNTPIVSNSQYGQQTTYQRGNETTTPYYSTTMGSNLPNNVSSLPKFGSV